MTNDHQPAHKLLMYIFCLLMIHFKAKHLILLCHSRTPKLIHQNTPYVCITFFNSVSWLFCFVQETWQMMSGETLPCENQCHAQTSPNRSQESWHLNRISGGIKGHIPHYWTMLLKSGWVYALTKKSKTKHSEGYFILWISLELRMKNGFRDNLKKCL